MSYSIKHWKDAVSIMKVRPDIPRNELADLFEIPFRTAENLIQDIVEIWKVERKRDYPKHIKQPKKQPK